MSQSPQSNPSLKTITGSCLCKQVKFEVSFPTIGMNNCHCSRCRKASGASFGTFLHTTTDFFKWTHGEENINNFIPKEGDPRPFCKHCGSRVPVVNLEKKHVVIPAGLLDDAPDLVPSVNLFVNSKAKWVSIEDALPAFEENAPDEFWATYFIAFEEKIAESS